MRSQAELHLCAKNWWSKPASIHTVSINCCALHTHVLHLTLARVGCRERNEFSCHSSFFAPASWLNPTRSMYTERLALKGHAVRRVPIRPAAGQCSANERPTIPGMCMFAGQDSAPCLSACMALRLELTRAVMYNLLASVHGAWYRQPASWLRVLFNI